MIEFDGVSRWYGQVIGVNDISCKIGPGLTALLGQNGAGKTTLIRLMTGQLRPTTGNLSVLGAEPFANAAVLGKIGYCPDIDNFYEHSTARQFVRFMGELSGISGQKAADRTMEVLKIVGMDAFADRKIAAFSKGMRQRIKLAQAMFHDPSLIVLDEPLNGLDPVGRREYIDMLHRLAGEGRIIIVSSHILYEVESMTKSIILLHRGRLLAEGDLGVIRGLIDKHPHRVRIEGPKPRVLAEAMVGLPNTLSVVLRESEHAIECEVKDLDSFYSALADLSVQKGLEIQSFTSPDNNLEAVFGFLVRN